VTISSILGFSSSVALTCALSPTKAEAPTCLLSPTSVQAAAHGSATSTLTVNTLLGVSPGTYSITVTGTSGATVHSTTVSLAVKPQPAFTIDHAPGQPTSQTVSAGQSAKFGLVVTPSGGFSGTVNLSCGLSPTVTPAPTCSLSNSSMQLGGSGSQTVTVTVGTTAPVTTGTISQISSPSGWVPLAWIGMLFGSGWLLLRNRKRVPVLAAPIIVLAVASWVGCGGGSSSSPHTIPGTPAGTYTVRVTATSGGLSHNTTSQVIVQ